MAIDEGRTSDRGAEAGPADRQSESARKDQHTQEKEVKQEPGQAGSRQETQPDDSLHRRDKKEAPRGGRGSSDWGGYQGY